jgi:hypothetical protein
MAKTIDQYFDDLRGTRVWRSIFRSGTGSSTLKRALAIQQNVFLHLFSTKVRTRMLSLSATWYLGTLTLGTFVILVATGIPLMRRKADHADGQLAATTRRRPASTPSRPSNVSRTYDNLEVKPHPFTEGDTLNKISDADLTAIISHGGPALNKSALMPAWGNTLSKSDIEALISYIRAVSDPPSREAGPVYAKN